MLKFHDDAQAQYLESVKTAAAATSAEAVTALQERLDYLDQYAQGRANCYIFRDSYAPNSFYLRMMDAADETKQWWNGGLIYSGPGLSGGEGARSDGGASSFTVSLNPDAQFGRRHMWSVHT